MPPDSTEDDTLPYPITPGDNGGIYLNQPGNHTTEVEYDPESGQYIITEYIGGLISKPPMYMTPEEYRDYMYKKQVGDYWEEKVIQNDPNRQAERPGDDGGLIPQIQVNNELFGKIFGGNTIEIRPQGFAELTFGARFQKIENPNLPLRNQKTFNFNFDQRIQMNVTGKIGEKLSLTTNYDTEATFSFENQMKLEFTGDEDDIIKKIEMGNVSLPINSSLITGAQSLFGIKGQFQFGQLTLTAVFSEQRSQTNSINIQGGATTNNFEIWGDQYEANKHYFLAHWFRDNYEKHLRNLPLITSPVQITRIEVWVTNRRNVTQDARNVVAMMDLGEADGPGAYRNSGAGIPGPSIFPGPSPSLNGLPANQNNQLDPSSLQQMYPGVRDIATANADLNAAGFEEATDFVELANARQLSPSEYTFHPQLGYISLNQALNQDEILAVAFQYTANGRTYQVGEFSTDGVAAPQTLVTKMLKSTILNVRIPLWDLMMKNVYSLGAFQVNKEDFRLDVLYMNDETGVPIPFLPSGNLKDQLLIRVMELDKVNNNNDPYSDGFFDFIPGVTINTQNGRIIFPVVEPFGSHLERKLDSQADRDRYAFTELYDSTRFKAQDQTQLNKFLLRGQYKSASSSEISLNAFNIPKGSVRVTAGGQVLQENVDYTVDYTLGRVRIINDGILNSGTPIKVDFENNTLFNVQTKTYMGLTADYKVNNNLNVGGTIINLTERPLTQKVNIGEEPISNTIWGMNATYNKETPMLTRWVDRIPFIDTKESSNITLQGEFAHLIPGSPRGIKIDGDETTYIDDFESSQTVIDVRNALGWSLASTPANQPEMFPEGDLNDDIAYGFNRAKLAWYTIDPIFYNNDGNTPQNIKDNPDLQSGQYVREVRIEEVFPNRNIDNQAARNIATLDLAYYPEERGPYNFDVEGMPGVSAGVDDEGKLLQPETRWGGIMRNLQTNNFEEQNIEFIQFWVLDPFLEDPALEGGDLYFNLGSVSEDVLKDGRQAFENGLSPTGDKTVVDSTSWGVVPKVQPIALGFDNDPASRSLQDLGLDGLSDGDEASWSHGGAQTYLDRIALLYGTGSNAYQRAQADPAGDNFLYYRGSVQDQRSADILERYKDFNNTQDNSSTSQQDGFPASSTQLPDIEDVNRDQTLSKTESYFQYKVSIRPQDMVVGRNYITDQVEAQVKLQNGNTTTATWYQFKIPIFEPDAKIGPIGDFRSIRFMRMFLTNFRDNIVLRFARLDLVRGEWRRYRFSLNSVAEDVPIDENDPTLFEVNAVNIEENASRSPVNYVLPPGIDRQQLFGTSSLLQQNEQSLSMRVCNLKDGDARAVFRNLSFDMRTYNRLRMFVHAEAFDNEANLDKGDLTLFIRMGSDYSLNYYEYELPLTPSPWFTTNPWQIWPEVNNIDFALEDLKAVKLERDRALRDDPGRSLRDRYTVPKGNATISVVGAPNLGNVRTIMIGVRNPKKRTPGDGDDAQAKCAEIWVNELRLTEFDERGGWAANARVTAKLADFGNISLAGRTSSIGFGSIDQSVTERQKESIHAYDLQTNFELGKFFPEDTRLRIPLYFGQSEEWHNPQFNPLDPDIEFEDALNNLNSEEDKEELKRKAQDYTYRRSVNLTNVRKDRDPQSKRKPQVYDVENLSASYSYTEVFRRNINTVFDTRKDYRGSLNYTYQIRPQPVEPFKKSKAFSSKWLTLIRDFNFYYYPQKFTFRNELVRSYNEAQQRNTDNPDFLLPTTYNKSFTWRRQYDVMYDITKALRFDYQANALNRIDEPQGPADADSVKSAIRNNLSNFGRPTQYQQSVNLNWAIPINKIPALDFVNSTARYSGTYNWQANSLLAQSSQNDTLQLGNTIQNSNSIQLNNQLNFVTLYNKWPYLQKLNQGGRSNRLSNRNVPPGRRQDQQNKDGEEEEKKDGFGSKALEFGARLLTSLKTASLNYQEDRGTLLPGFLYEPEHFGMNSTNGWAPGAGFVFGFQPPDDLSNPNDIRRKASENGWLTQSTLLNNQYQRTYSQSINVRGTLEPIRDLRIDVTATKSENENVTAFYRFDELLGEFAEQNRMMQGSYNISFYALPTAFDVSSAPSYSSDAFNQFLENRLIISRRLAEGYAAIDPSYTAQLVGDPDSANYGYDGFSVSSQEVLIPAFLAAYSGRNAETYNLSPFRNTPLPNWNLTYDGLMRLRWFKDNFSSFTLNHSYRSTYSVGNFTTNLALSDSIQQGGGEVRYRNRNGDFIPEVQITQVSVTENFAPLLGVNVRMKNSITARMEYKRDRNMSLSLANNQLTETKGVEYVIGLGYIIKDLKFNFIRVGAQGKAVQSNLELKADISIRDNVTVVRRILEDLNQVNSGQRLINIKISADYAISQRITAKVFYDQTLSRYKVSTAFPTSNTNVGISIRLNLGQ